MVLSKKQKAYVAVLGLAAVALIVDRTVLAPSDAAVQESVASPLPAGSENASARVPGARQSPRRAKASESAGRCLADRLHAMAKARSFDLSNVKNAFGTPQSWRAEARKVAPVVVQDAVQVEKFRQGHRLTAVIVAAGGGSAIVDGKSYLLGQELDGFKLVSVTERSAVWVSGGHRVELTIPVEVEPGAPK